MNDITQTSNELAPRGYDYSGLSSEVSIKAQVAAERVKIRINRTVDDIIEIGKDLIDVKESLPHGEFGKWIESEFGMSERTAYNFMVVSGKFGSKVATVATFGSKVLYALAAPSTPDAIIEKAQEKAEAGEKVTLDDVKKWKDEAKRERELRQETKNLLEQLMEEKEALLELNKAPQVIEREVIKEVIPEDYETLKQKESILKNAEHEAYRKIEMAKDKASEILTPIEDRVNELKDQENFLSGRVNQLTNDLSLFTTEERDREVRRKETDNLYKEIKSYLAVIGDTKVSEIALSEKQRIVELLEVTNNLSKLLSLWLGHSGNYIEGELV